MHCSARFRISYDFAPLVSNACTSSVCYDKNRDGFLIDIGENFSPKKILSSHRFTVSKCSNFELKINSLSQKILQNS